VLRLWDQKAGAEEVVRSGGSPEMKKPMKKIDSMIVFMTLRGGGLQAPVYLCNDHLAHRRDGHDFRPFHFALGFDMRLGPVPRLIIKAEDGRLDWLDASVINATLELAPRDRPRKTDRVVRTVGRKRGHRLLLRVEDDEPCVNFSDLY
jgi:hypothetical protein